MKKASISFIFDFPLEINAYSIFDVGSDKRYIDWEKSVSNFESAYKSSIKDELDALFKASSKKEIPLSACFSGTFLQLLESVDEAQIDNLKKAAGAKLEILGGTFCHSLTSVYSLQQITFEIEKHRDLVKRLIGVKPTRFYNSENIYFTDLANKLHQLGFKSTFAGAIDWYLGNDKYRRIFNVPDNKNFKVFLTDGDAGNSFFDHDDQDIHFLQFDLSMIKQFAGLKSIVKVVKRKAEVLSLSDLAKAAKNPSPYRIKSPTMGSINDKSLDDYIGQGMQSSIFSLYYDIHWPSLAKDDKLAQEYLYLGQLSMFEALSVHRENGGMSSYERYSRLINMLSDLKIRLG